MKPLGTVAVTAATFVAFTPVHANLLNALEDIASGSSSTPAAISSSCYSSSLSSTPSSFSSTSLESQTISSTTPCATSEVTLTFSLLATNPTAVPLSLINSDEPIAQTRALSATPTAGAVPTYMSDAPNLPDISTLDPSDYPSLDKIPPVDSEEVRNWIQEVKDSGVVIPSLSITNPGGCTNNTDISEDGDRCWWTCGGCTRSTDVTECPTAMDWGLTYDDGPSPYTPDLLAYLDEVNLKATFFVVGSRAISYPEILQAEYMAGHQIAVHTWSHPALTTLSDEEIIAELGWTRKVVKDVLGVTPNMMRPPTGDIDDRVRAISLAMGLTPVMWSSDSSHGTLFDTDDYKIKSGQTSVQQVLNNWKNIMGNVTSRSSGFIVLEHDLFEQTVEVATGYILPDALAHQPPFRIQPVISCLGRDMMNAYVETNTNQTETVVVFEAIASKETTIDESQSFATPTANVTVTTTTSSAIMFSPELFSAIGICSFVVVALYGSLA